MAGKEKHRNENQRKQMENKKTVVDLSTDILTVTLMV